MGNKSVKLKKRKDIELPAFIELYDKDLEAECPKRKDCNFQHHEIDLFTCRLGLVRCSEHGEVYGRTVQYLWR